MAWLALQPGGIPFHLSLVTETAIRGYMDFLAATNRAPRTRSKALSALRRFCQWAGDEGHLLRNPAHAMERPTVVAVAPTELSYKQRFVLKTMVEQHAMPRFAAYAAHRPKMEHQPSPRQLALGVNLVVAAIILWNTLEPSRAIEELRSEGVEMTAEQLRHLSPMDWEHISLTGDYTWDFISKNTRT